MADSGVVHEAGADREIPQLGFEGLRLLERCAQPMWVYSYARKSIVWANPPGLAFWEAGSRGEVLQRDVSPASLGVAQRLENLRHRLREMDRVEELWTLFPHGAPKSVTIGASLVRLDDGDTGLWCEIVPQPADQDHAAKTYQAELRAIEAVNHAPMMISMMTPSGGWLMHNPAGEALMRRLGHDNIPNMDNFSAMFADPARALALRAAAIESGTARDQLRLCGALPRFHDVTLRRIVDPATGQMAIMLSQLDITRAKVLERRLERALENERAMSETQRHFLSLTSHEFRTPLAIIASSVRRLRAALGQQPGADERLDIIANAVTRMQNAIEKTLWAGRIDAGRVPFLPCQVDLQEIMARAIAVQQELHPERRIETHLEPVPALTGDAVLIEQAVDNLLSNAIKFSPAAEPIEVSCRREDNTVALAVRDRGLGIPAEDLPRIFSRFFRASNARGIKGTGIGLAAVRHFMELHGGTVDIAARDAGGLCVTLRFPTGA